MYKEDKDWDGRLGDVPDGKSQRDAERCVTALKKRFPTGLFFAKRWKLGTWTVEEDHELDAATFAQAQCFAQGFMASAILWER